MINSHDHVAIKNLMVLKYRIVSDSSSYFKCLSNAKPSHYFNLVGVPIEENLLCNEPGVGRVIT